MTDIIIQSISISFSALLCFFIGLFFIPTSKHFFALDERLFVGVFAALSYVFSHLVFMQSAVNLSVSAELLMAVLFVAITFIAFWISLFIKMGKTQVEYTYSLGLWFAGSVGVCMALQLYSYAIISLCFVVFLKLAGMLLLKLNMDMTLRTLVIDCNSYKTIERIELMLKAFNIQVMNWSLTKEKGLTLTLDYKASSMANHVLKKHVLSRKDLNRVVIHGG